MNISRMDGPTDITLWTTAIESYAKHLGLSQLVTVRREYDGDLYRVLFDVYDPGLMEWVRTRQRMLLKIMDENGVKGSVVVIDKTRG